MSAPSADQALSSVVVQLAVDPGSDLEHRSAFLDEHAKLLLSDAADAMLAVLYRSFSDHRPFQDRIEAIRLGLDEARNKGFDGVDRPLSWYFEGLFGPGGPIAEVELPPDRPVEAGASQLGAVLLAFLLSPSWEERRRLATTYSVLLLTDEAEQALLSLGQDIGGESHVFATLSAVLADARARGPNAAFAGYLPPAFIGGPTPAERPRFTRGESLELALLAYTRTSTWERRREIVRSDPEALLSDEAANMLASSVERYTDDPGLSTRLQVAADVLAAARTKGIDAAFTDDLPPTGTRYRMRVGLDFTSDGSDRLLTITAVREAIFQVDRALAPLTWASLNLGLAGLLVAVDLHEPGLRPVYGEEALLRCSLALEVVTEQSAPGEWLAAQALLGRIFLHRQRGDRAMNGETAIAYLADARKRFIQQGDINAALEATVSLAQAYDTWAGGVPADNIEMAYALCSQAVSAIEPATNSARWAEAKVVLAQICTRRRFGVRQDNLREAARHLLDAVAVPELPQGLVGMAEYMLGSALALAGDEATVWRDHLQRALELFPLEESPFHWASAHHGLGVGFFRSAPNDPDSRAQACEHYRAALDVFRSDTYPGERRRTLKELGAVLFRERRWQESLEALAEAISLSDYLESSAFTDVGQVSEIAETINLFERCAYCLLRLNRAGEALAMLDLGKTRTLRRAVSTGDDIAAAVRWELDDAVVELSQLVRGELPILGGLASSLAQARVRLTQAKARVDEATSSVEGEGLSAEDIRSLVPEGGALVVPVVTSQGSALFVLTANAKEPHGDVVPLDDLTDDDLRALFDGTDDEPGWLTAYHGWVDAYDALADAALFDEEVVDVADREYSKAEGVWAKTMGRACAQLWRMLMGPLHERLVNVGVPTGATVVLMPSKWLPLVPLHAAWRKTPAGRRFFVDDYAVAYAPSAFVYARCRAGVDRRALAMPSLLAVIDPTGDLRFAGTEGERVAAHFPGAANILAGSEAVPGRLVGELPGRTHLHLACHGSFDWRDPLSSAVVLAGGDHLTVKEISSLLSLEDVRLVTLSACETGIIESDRVPNEYLGLPSVFLQVGALGVVSTLWNVDDEATALLMERFYDGHIDSRQSPAVALRLAQLHVRNTPDFEHPFYWAAFVAVGA